MASSAATVRGNKYPPAVVAPSPGTLVAFGYACDAMNQRVGKTASDSSWLGYPFR